MKRGWLALALVFLGYAFIQVQEWDEADREALRQEAARVQDGAFRALAENTTYREYLKSDKHCRAPVVGERLTMEIAGPGDPGKGYRCTYVSRLHPMRGVEYSRTPGLMIVSRRVSLWIAP